MTQWGLDTLFNPAKRHMDEEKRRLQSTREQIGDSSGGKRIDLESGKVTIRRGTADGESAAEAEPVAEDEAGVEAEPGAGATRDEVEASAPGADADEPAARPSAESSAEPTD